MSRAGIVTVAGKPNAGKSTLLNRLVGEKLAITSPKPQSTRHRVVGIRSVDDTQMVVLDTPGLLDPKDLLHQAMRGASLAAVRDADVLVYVVDASALPITALRNWIAAQPHPTPTEQPADSAERLSPPEANAERVAVPSAASAADLTAEPSTEQPAEPSAEDALPKDPLVDEISDEDAFAELSDELAQALRRARVAPVAERRTQRAARGAPQAAGDTASSVATASDPASLPWPTFLEAAALERAPRARLLTVLNKSDVLPADVVEALRLLHPELLVLSALTGEGIDPLVSAITEQLPESPYLYPADEISTLPMRFFCAEFVRETAMEQLGDELPHALACAIDEYREGSSPLYIRAVLYVERDSQKAIVIGAGGQQIKKLGRAARVKIEQFVGEPVYLDLWVKVLANWRRKRGAVSRLGYGDPTP